MKLKIFIKEKVWSKIKCKKIFYRNRDNIFFEKCKK